MPPCSWSQQSKSELEFNDNFCNLRQFFCINSFLIVFIRFLIDNMYIWSRHLIKIFSLVVLSKTVLHYYYYKELALSKMYNPYIVKSVLFCWTFLSEKHSSTTAWLIFGPQRNKQFWSIQLSLLFPFLSFFFPSENGPHNRFMHLIIAIMHIPMYLN